jgi:phospholipase C
MTATSLKLRALRAAAPLLVASLGLSACNSSSVPASTPGTAMGTQEKAAALGFAHHAVDFSKIQHIIVIYQENWPLTGLYGQLAGANGTPPGTTVVQNDWRGRPLTSVPQPLDYNGNPDKRFPASLPVQTYLASKYVPANEKTGDIVHRFYHEQYQIDGGKMDKFVTYSDNGGLVLSQYDATTLPEGDLIKQYTLASNFFHSAFGGSFLNHQYLICACAPTWPNAPSDYISVPNKNPAKLNDNHVTPDGYVVNTSYSTYQPHPPGSASGDLVPPQTAPTIGDRLNDASISWKWYSGGWDAALAGHPSPLFQFHHQPFAYYQNYGDGTKLRAEHLQDEKNFKRDIANGKLPSVVFIKQIGQDNEHPGYSSLLHGQLAAMGLIDEIRQSQYWQNSVIILTYDENGGRWDNVGPPQIDRWGPGSRVPAVIVSPFSKQNYIDTTQYETASILALIEQRYGLKPLAKRDKLANPFENAFDFSQQHR